MLRYAIAIAGAVALISTAAFAEVGDVGSTKVITPTRRRRMGWEANKVIIHRSRATALGRSKKGRHQAARCRLRRRRRDEEEDHPRRQHVRQLDAAPHDHQGRLLTVLERQCDEAPRHRRAGLSFVGREPRQRGGIRPITSLHRLSRVEDRDDGSATRPTPATLAAQALGWIDQGTGAVVLPVHTATTFCRDPTTSTAVAGVMGAPDNCQLRPAPRR